MKATVMYAAGDVRVETVPDPSWRSGRATSSWRRSPGPTGRASSAGGDGYRAMNERQAIKVMIDLA